MPNLCAGFKEAVKRTAGLDSDAGDLVARLMGFGTDGASVMTGIFDPDLAAENLIMICLIYLVIISRLLLGEHAGLVSLMRELCRYAPT